jgi:hypothetical protein
MAAGKREGCYTRLIYDQYFMKLQIIAIVRTSGVMQTFT